MAAKMSLDSFDKKILDCLQDEADMALAEIARRVGLSTTPCWRRINRLQEAGVIRARVALLERKAVNAGVTVFVAVRTAQHNAQWLSRFAKAVASFPEVMDCYRMSGEIDYLIRLALPDIEAYDAFYKRLIAKVELCRRHLHVRHGGDQVHHAAPAQLPALGRAGVDGCERRLCRQLGEELAKALVAVAGAPAHRHAQEGTALAGIGLDQFVAMGRESRTIRPSWREGHAGAFALDERRQSLVATRAGIVELDGGRTVRRRRSPATTDGSGRQTPPTSCRSIGPAPCCWRRSPPCNDRRSRGP